MVAMANAGPDQNKSQFFITYAKQPHLDGTHPLDGIHRLTFSAGPYRLQVNIQSLAGENETSSLLDTCLSYICESRFRVIDGADDALSLMEKVPVNAKNRPLEPIKLEKVRLVHPLVRYPLRPNCTQTTIHANPLAKPQ